MALTKIPRLMPRYYKVKYPTGCRKRGSVGYLVLSGEGSGVRGGGVRGTAGLGAMEAAGTKPGAMFFYTTHTGS